MNASHRTAIFAALIAAFALPAAAAAGPLAPVVVEAGIEVACSAPRLPGQRQIAEEFGVANLGQAYELKRHLHHLVSRTCHGGADRVRITLQRTGAAGDSQRYVAVRD
jgi:hypothetical protein